MTLKTRLAKLALQTKPPERAPLFDEAYERALRVFEEVVGVSLEEALKIIHDHDFPRSNENVSNRRNR